MDKEKIALVVLLFVVLFTVGVWVGQLTWHWIVPDVFGGMVDAGLLPERITFWQSFKLMLLLGVFIGRGVRGKQ